MAVYATHKNWQTAYTSAPDAADKPPRPPRCGDASTRIRSASSRPSRKRAARRQQARSRARQPGEPERRPSKSEVDELVQESRADAELVAATEENNNRLTEEVVGLRKSIREHQQARDGVHHDAQGDHRPAHDRRPTAAAPGAQRRNSSSNWPPPTPRVIEGGVDPDGSVVPRVRGVVSATRRADGGQLIEITIGADDGIKPGQTVEIFRGERYLGRAEILRADPDRAVGRVHSRIPAGTDSRGRRCRNQASSRLARPRAC